MGDHIGIGQALIITGFSMIVVFAGLIIISILISGLKNIGREKNEKVEEVIEKRQNMIEKEPLGETVKLVDDEELVAVIAAAIASNMGVSVPQLNIRKIRRVPQHTPTWAVAGRKDQIAEKL